MVRLVETLSSYVPYLLARRLETDPAPISTPTTTRFPAAVLFADISGFTALTERLGERGLVGAEELDRHLVDPRLEHHVGHLAQLVQRRPPERRRDQRDRPSAVRPVPLGHAS